MGEARPTGCTRVPAHSPRRPARELFALMMLIAMTVGLDLIALLDALDRHFPGWAVVFVAAVAVKVGLYGWLARDWSRWV